MNLNAYIAHEQTIVRARTEEGKEVERTGSLGGGGEKYFQQ